jgi:hypothetical protein
MFAEEGLRGGWFFAWVIMMADKEALVIYDDLLTDDGSLLIFSPLRYIFQWLCQMLCIQVITSGVFSVQEVPTTLPSI